MDYNNMDKRSSKDAKEKRKQTLLTKYGVENVSQLAFIKSKKQETCKQHFGVEFPSQSKEVMQKIENTNLRTLGVRRPAQSIIIRSKMKDTTQKLYGESSYSKTSEYLNKVKTTNQKNLGVDFPMQSSVVKQRSKDTVRRIYGVNNVAQSPEIMQKIVRTVKSKYGDDFYARQVLNQSKVYPNKKEIIIQGLFPEFLQFNINTILTLPNDTHLVPDIIVKDQNKVIEHFGSFWHSEKNTKESEKVHETKKIRQYESIGYKCLVIWESELKDLNTVKYKIQQFLMNL